MTYVPHYRLTLAGPLGGAAGGEIFSCNLAIARGDDAGLAAPLLEPDNDVWDDIRDDCVSYWASGSSGIHPDAVLQMVKIADIGADGHYRSAPVERAVNQAGGGTVGPRHPNQVALAATLHTGGDLNRVKGRVYLPLPRLDVEQDGKVAAATIDVVEGAFKDLIDNLNNQPGLDVLDLRVVVASQGRHNANGSVRVGPANHLVTGVSFGRVLDTQRRRRNALAEGRTLVAVNP